MTTRFLTELQNFADAAYPIDDHSLLTIWDLVSKFLIDIAKINYFEILLHQMGKKGPQLGTVLTQTRYWSHPVPAPDTIEFRKPYQDQTGYSFAENINLWVQKRSQTPLAAKGRDFINCWVGSPSLRTLPPYYAFKEWTGSLTQIVIPLVVGVPIGILVLETKWICKYDPRLAEVFVGIAKALATILSTHEACKLSRQGTENALGAVTKGYETTKKNDKEHPLAEPSLFLASSKRADKEVIQIIQKTVDLFKDTVQLNFWQDWTTSNEIKTELMKSVARADYAICYFSEPSVNSAGAEKYQDNPNVLFEAGMLHALTTTGVGESLSTTPLEWLAVREGASLPVPFDFGDKNILVVPRLENGNLDKARFARKLTACLKTMIKNKRSEIVQ